MSKKKKSTQSAEKVKELMLLTPCKTKDEMNRWIKYHLGLQLPDATVSRYADTNPLDIIWEIYELCVIGNNPKNIDEILCVAGRGTGKTLGMAIVELMLVLHDQRDVVHVGAVQAQADRCYNYVKNFLYNKKLKDVVMPSRIPEEERILEKANMSKSIFNIKNNKVTMEVIPCTLKACLVAETKAECLTGKIKQLKEFKKGDYIKSPSGWTEVIDNSLEEKECLRVELEDGRIIEGTLDHKVWTNRGWVELKDLSDEHEIL